MIFESIGMTRPGIEPRSPGPKTLTIMPINQQQKKREHAKLWTFLSQLTTEWNWKKKKDKYLDLAKEIKKNYGIWRC